MPQTHVQDVERREGNKRKRERKGWSDGEREFQPSWAELYPCIEKHEEEVDGRLKVLACCAICSWKKRSPHTMQPKLDTIEKHLGKIYEKKIVDGKEEGVIRWKTAIDCMHVRNEEAYKKHIWEEEMKEKSSIPFLHRKALEKQMRSTILQVQTVFHILRRGRPMLDYEYAKAYLVAIGIPDLPSSHWSRKAGWEFGSAIDQVIKDDLRETIQKCEYFSISLDEASAKDLSSWVSMNIYCVRGHIRQSHYVAVKKMLKDATALSLFEIVKENLVSELQLSLEDIAKKLVCIGVDGCSVMQGHRTGLCVRVQTTLAPYALAIHCMAHRMDLAYQIVDTFKCIENIEGLVSCAATFFCRSPKRYLQFQEMSQGLTKGKKLMKTVNTRWISLYYPAKRLFEEYPSLIGLMDKLVNEGDTDKATELLVRLTDLETLFTLAGFLPMLNEMNMLVKLASKESMYISELWRILDNSQVLCERMPEYFRVADLCQALILGSVEDERTFSALGILKNKVRNRLTANLDTSLRIYSCKYDDLNFPYQNALAIWQSSLDRRDRKTKKKILTAQDVQAVVISQEEDLLDGWQA